MMAIYLGYQGCGMWAGEGGWWGYFQYIGEQCNIKSGQTTIPGCHILRQSVKQSTGPHAAPLMTRINFNGRSPQAGGPNIDPKR